MPSNSIHLCPFLAFVSETLVLRICICNAILLHWGHFQIEDSEIYSCLWNTILLPCLPTEIPHWSASILFNKSQLMAQVSRWKCAKHIWSKSTTLSATEHLDCWNHSEKRSLPVLGGNKKQLNNESVASSENQYHQLFRKKKIGTNGPKNPAGSIIVWLVGMHRQQETEARIYWNFQKFKCYFHSYQESTARFRCAWSLVIKYSPIFCFYP